MGLLDSVKAGVAAAYTVSDGFMEDVTVTRQLSGSFDPDTGDVTTTPDPQSFRALVSPVTQKDRDNNSVPETATTKVVIEYAGLDWVPDTNATVTWSGTSQEYEILDLKNVFDSVLILWVLA